MFMRRRCGPDGRVCPSALPALLCAAALLAPAHPAAAQQTYVLGDDESWAHAESPDPATPEGQLAEARRALAQDDPVRAQNLTNRFIEQHPHHPLLPEAYLIRGDAKVAAGDEYQALFDYEFIARTYPGSEAFVTALERELEIAREYAAGKRRKLFGMRIVDASSEAEEIFIRVQERLPGSRLAEAAGMELGDFYFQRGNMRLAAEAYDLFIENYPRSGKISKARRRLIYAHLASFKGPEYDAAGLHEARLRLLDLMAVEPATAEEIGAEGLLARIEESDAQKLLENARWYLRRGDAIAAELTIRRLVRQHPDTVAAAGALRIIPRVLDRLPPRIIEEQAPDYDALRAGILGIIPAEETDPEDRR